jgi:hypothetical protein
MQWIKYLSKTEGVQIQHARNGGERKLDLIKWMDITKTRTDRNTSWNLTKVLARMFTLLQCQHGQPGQWYDHG